MFNSGIRGKRANDNQGTVSAQSKFVQTTNPQPAISGYVISGIDDTQLDPAGGQTVLINGTGFATGISAVLGGTQISAVTLVSPTQISFTTPAKSAGSHSLVVYNSTGGAAILVPGLAYSSIPSYTTSAGTLGTFYETTAISTQVVATSDSSLTYSLISGTLPSGSTLNSNGTITGTSPIDSSSTTYTFAIKATDAELQDVTRTFTLTINTDVVSWSSPADSASYTLIGGQAMSNVSLSATSAAGYGVSYTANALPTGVTLTSGTISGTPTVAATTNTLLTATAATTGRSATRTVSWIVILGDSYWKYTSLLLSGSTPTTTFINDASLNNAQLTVVGDTKPNNFSPYQGNGYYSVSHSATPDYLSIPHNSNFSLTSGQTDTFIIEGWFYFNAVTAQTSLFDKSGVNTVSFANWTVYLNASSQITLQWGVSGTPGTATVGLIASTTVPVTGTWYHIAFVKSNADWAVFANGTRIITYNGLNTAGDANPSALKIGYGIQGAANGAYFSGYVSNVRAWRGTTGAPYSATSATLTVPTSPLTAITGTTLLTHQSSRFVDVSSANATVTATGANIKVSSVIPFAANSSYSTYGSAYFDGTGDYLSAPASLVNNLTGTWTVEAWCYMTQAPTGNTYNTSFPILTVEDGAGNMGHYWGVGTTAFVCMYRDSSSYDTITGTMPSINQWFHIAITNVGSTVSVYINGVLAGSKTQTAGTWNSTIATVRSNIGALYTYGYAKGHIADFRIVNGTAVYTANFTPPTTPLTAVANTQLLALQYNGGANNNGFVDRSGFNNIITRNGNTSQGTFSPFSQNGWSNYFNGTTDYISIASGTVTIGTATDYTVEAWVYITGLTGAIQIISGGQGSNGVGFIITNSLQLQWNKVNVGGGYTSTGTLSLNQWTHVSVCRGSGTTRFWINGVLAGSNADATSFSSTSIQLGASGAAFWLKGYISNFRQVVGTALYTTAFTPSTTPLTPITNTISLSCQSNSFVDNSFVNGAITVTGTASIQAFSPFGSVTSVPTSYSLLQNIDGSVQFPRISTNTKTDLGSGAFTVEGWFYPTASMASKNTRIISLGRDSAGTNTSWDLYISNGTSIVWNRINTTATTYSASYTFNLNTWYHVAVCRDGANNLAIFVNGTRVLAQANETTSYDYVPASQSNHYVGASYNGTTWSYGRGYYSNIRVIKSATAYDPTQSNITVPTAQLSITANTSVLLFASRICEDSTGVYAVDQNYPIRAFNPFGNTTTTNVSYSPSVNGGSMYFDGTGDYLSFPGITIGTNAYTVECWFYISNFTSAYAFLGTSNPNALDLRINNATTFAIDQQNVAQTTFTVPTMTPNTWYHVAFVRTSANQATVFLNGVKSSTGFVSMTTNYNALSNYIGLIGANYFPGYIADFRVITGTALYTANFYPGSEPATPTTQIGTTTYASSLLLNGTSGGIIDYHGTNNLETVGNTQLGNQDPYQGNYYSLFYDGLYGGQSGNAINGTQSGARYTLSTPVLGAGDFTIEVWCYNTAATVSDDIYGNLFDMGTTFGLLRYYSNVGWQYYLDGTAHNVNFTATIPNAQQRWVHHAIVRSGTTVTWWVNGYQAWTGTSSTNITTTVYNTSSSYAYAWTGYQNHRVVKGTALYDATAATITVPTTPFTNVSGTILLLNGNSLKDLASGITPTLSGDAPKLPAVSMFNPFRQNTGKSIYFDGTGDYLFGNNTQFQLGTGTSTIEFWMYLTSYGDPTSAGGVLFNGVSSADSPRYQMGWTTSGIFNVHYQSTTASQDVNTAAGIVKLNQWQHYAIVLNGTTHTTYVDGVSQATATITVTSPAAGNNLYIGFFRNDAALRYMTGYIKDLRVTKGIARYTTTFTPPTTPMQIK